MRSVQPPMTFEFGPARLRLRDFAVTLEAAVGGYVLKVAAEASHSGLSKGCPVGFTGDIRLDGGSRPWIVGSETSRSAGQRCGMPFRT